MSRNLPFAVIAVALLNCVLALMYATAAGRQPTDLWLVPASLAFTGGGLLAVAVGLKLRELGARLSEVERQLGNRPAA